MKLKKSLACLMLPSFFHTHHTAYKGTGKTGITDMINPNEWDKGGKSYNRYVRGWSWTTVKTINTCNRKYIYKSY